MPIRGKRQPKPLRAPARQEGPHMGQQCLPLPTAQCKYRLSRKASSTAHWKCNYCRLWRMVAGCTPPWRYCRLQSRCSNWRRMRTGPRHARRGRHKIGRQEAKQTGLARYFSHQTACPSISSSIYKHLRRWKAKKTHSPAAAQPSAQQQSPNGFHAAAPSRHPRLCKNSAQAFSPAKSPSIRRRKPPTQAFLPFSCANAGQ